MYSNAGRFIRSRVTAVGDFAQMAATSSEYVAVGQKVAYQGVQASGKALYWGDTVGKASTFSSFSSVLKVAGPVVAGLSVILEGNSILNEAKLTVEERT